MANAHLNSTDAPISTANNRHTRRFLVVYYLVAELWGIRSIWYWETSALDYFVPFALAIALGWWAVVDAKRRRRPIPMFAQPWFILLAMILVPTYIIWSRRWRGVGYLALHAALWYALATATMHVGGIILFGRGWLRAFDI